MGKETCQRCGNVDYDRRTLWMSCFYEMGELGLPFTQSPPQPMIAVLPSQFYTLRVCKDCRADWMGAISVWFKNPPKRESIGSGIFIRRNGATVEITEDEWNDMNPLKQSRS